MEAAKTILGQSDIESFDAMAPNEKLTVSIEGYDDLVFEKVGPTRLSVGHRTVRRGGRVRDPEAVFRIEGGAWIPIEYTSGTAVHRYDATGLAVEPLLGQWGERLRQQGFLEATTERVSTP
jgi:hypothetical protein